MALVEAMASSENDVAMGSYMTVVSLCGTRFVLTGDLFAYRTRSVGLK